MTPIIAALVLAVPVSVLTSRVGTGERARRWRLFLIPEETAPPRELVDVSDAVRAAEQKARALAPAERDGFVRAVVDPYVNALHRALLRGRRSLGATIRARRTAMLERALAAGPEALAEHERRTLLRDPELTDALHDRVWALPDRALAGRWGRPGGWPRSG